MLQSGKEQLILFLTNVFFKYAGFLCQFTSFTHFDLNTYISDEQIWEIVSFVVKLDTNVICPHVVYPIK